jgi:hypothetical protein
MPSTPKINLITPHIVPAEHQVRVSSIVFSLRNTVVYKYAVTATLVDTTTTATRVIGVLFG